MKKVFLFVVLFLVTNLYSQKIDTNNFNYPLLEKMVLQKINEYRKSKNLSELYYSEILKVNGSLKTSTANAEKDSAFHMPPPHNNEVLNRKLYNELYVVTNGKCGVEKPKFVHMSNGLEIICVNIGIDKTYEELSNRIVKGWLNSPKHKVVIDTNFDGSGGTPGFFSCSTKKSKSGRYYTTVNFVTIWGGYL